ncbi:MAG TPA: hypothetical protein VMH87_07495 [Pseudomonadales bacterium]|nr:hypothetical protein [Pseudomonadales bacterium]
MRENRSRDDFGSTDEGELNSQLSTLNSQRRSQSGVALVVTLILLSVTLVMAIAFLAVSRRERNSVSTESDTTAAKLASDSALAQAEARIVSQILITTNPYIQSLLVSTNYINTIGFTNGSANYLNVNYISYNNGPGPLSVADFDQNIANLYYNPRAPVSYSNDFRFYLDLNRNGEFDTNGVVTNLDNQFPPRGLGTTSLQIGDPEWIGVLEHPDQPHGPNNQFIARYCYIAVPANTLDINEIHNQALNGFNGNNNVLAPPTGDAYSRNQGVGSWEINLAAFLTDLNPNQWDPLVEPYRYPEIPLNSSFAFDDARALIAWRYADSYLSLSNANSIFGNVGANFWVRSGLDGYSAWQQTTFNTNYAVNYVGPVSTLNPSSPWLGSHNANDFFYTPAEYFDPTKSSPQFVNRIFDVGTSNDTYDRYTFYRMLGQIGSDSLPESDKININYSNAVVDCDANGVLRNLTAVPNLETNFFFWQPQSFFTAAADKMLHAYSAEWYEESPSNYVQTYYGISGTILPPPHPPYTYFTNIDGMQATNIAYYGQTNQIPAFGITNIPVYVNGTFAYTPAINRVLQLAANIYDSVTYSNDTTAGISNYPSVFRPVFWTTNEFSVIKGERFTNVYIKGYQYITRATNGVGDSIFASPIEVTDLPFGISVSNVWGVPWIIGAKKGFPNLDKVEVENNFFIERLLQFNRVTNTTTSNQFPFGRGYSTNQMYIMGISNYFGLADANNYAENYNNPVALVARDTLSLGISWTNPPAPASSGIGSAIANTYFGSVTNTQLPFHAQTSVMLLGTNLFNYTLAAGGYILNSMNTRVSLPFVLNPGNSLWFTNSSFVYYYGPGSTNFTGPAGGLITAPNFIPTFLNPQNYLDRGTPQLPQMTLLMTNRLQAYMVDSNGRILDYVQLGGMNNTANLNQNIADESYGFNNGIWSTNGYMGGDMPYGVYEQFLVSSTENAAPPGEDQDGGGWRNTPVPGTSDTTPAAQQAFFAAFFSPQNRAPYAAAVGGYVTNSELSMQAPYTPIRVSTQRFIYEANDPLVHYITSDLTDPNSSTNSRTTDNPILSKLSSANDRYAPWGTLGQTGAQMDQNQYNMAYKDSLVASADNWDFPTNMLPSIGWLGRVHRGTPWQTVYLKSTNILQLVQQIANGPLNYIGSNTWVHWTGNVNNYFDALNMAPIQDRLLFDLFTVTPNDDATRGRLSVNVGANDPNNSLAGLAAWSSVLSGVMVFSNNIPYQTVGRTTHYQNPLANQTGLINLPGQGYSAITIQPAGFNTASSPMAEIVQGINNARTNFVAIDGLHGVFEHVGDILAAPQLADQSPLLNTNNISFGGAHTEIQNGISDEMYEWLPQQIMGLLTVNGTPQSPPRYVIYCYGQTLKPAPNGIVTSGTFFGLVTNYQVTAESASRAIIRVDNTPTPANPNATPHIVVEQYNPLPPD